MTEILNAHGSRNDIFVAAMPPRDFASEADLQAFVRRLCDRNGPFGGDGIYFYDAGPRVPEAWFFNPDGSSAEFCGNGMRCLGRVILELRGADAATIRSGPQEYTVRRGPTTTEGVRQISLEHPALDFTPDTPVVAGRRRLYQARLPELDPALTFTAVSIPNPHLVALIDTYVESDLIAMGERVAASPDVFPAGANLSVLLPLEPAEVFVRTFERGAGLTASCGSGMAAARAVYSVTSRIDPEREVVVRNAGGMATVSLRVRQAGGTRSWRATPRSSTGPRSIRTRWPGVTRARPRNANPMTTRAAPTPPSRSGMPRGSARPASRPSYPAGATGTARSACRPTAGPTTRVRRARPAAGSAAAARRSPRAARFRRTW